MSLAHVFWDAYRERLKTNLTAWGRDSHAEQWAGKVRTDRWTGMLKETARQACLDLQPLLGCTPAIGGERIKRLDVHASDPASGELLVAFESELGMWGHKGGWENEFVKLCGIDARLRALYCTFEKGEGRRYPGLLQERLEMIRPAFEAGRPGEFLLIAGPAYNRKDPDQPWLAYSIGPGLALTHLSPDDPLLACRYLDAEVTG